MLVSSSCLQMIHLVCLFQYELDQIKFCYLFRMSFNILTELPSRLSSTLPPSSILNKKGLVRYSQYDNQGISIQIHGLWQKAVSFPWPLTRVDKLAEHCKGCCVVLLDGLHDTLLTGSTGTSETISQPSGRPRSAISNINILSLQITPTTTYVSTLIRSSLMFI